MELNPTPDFYARSAERPFADIGLIERPQRPGHAV